MSLIKIKDKGQTPDQFETLVVNTAVAVEATLGNIVVAGENGAIVDSGTAVSQITGELNNLGTEVEALGSEVETLKKSVSDGKTLLANAITEMGIETASDASFETMASNVSELSTAGEYIWARYKYEKHKAGLYDVDNNLIADWDTLVNTYGMNIEKDYAFNVDEAPIDSPCYILINNPELASGAKLVISSSVTKIGHNVFLYCETLQSVIIPESVTEIGEYAFCECTNLTSITIPASVIRIDFSAFRNCTSLTSVYHMHMGTMAPGWIDRVFYKTSGDTTTFYFKNSDIREAFSTNFGNYYNDSLAILSEDYSWTAPEVDIKADKIFLDYILSSDENKYPDGGEVDGYWYEVIDQQDAITYTPSTVDQVVPSGTLLTGDLTIVGDENLVPSNIAEGVNVFGTLGTFASGHKYIKRFFEQQITIPGMSRGTFDLAQTLDNPDNAFFFGKYLISSDDNIRFESMTNTTVTLFNYMSSSYTVYFSVIEFTDKLKSKDTGMHLCGTYNSGWTGTTPVAPYIALCQATTYNQKADIAILDATYDTSDFNNRTTASSRAAVTLSSGKLKYTVKQNTSSNYHYIHHYYAEFYE